MGNVAAERRWSRPCSADGVYWVGGIGALVYFWQQADSFGGYLLALLKSGVWPAFLVYDAFRAVSG